MELVERDGGGEERGERVMFCNDDVVAAGVAEEQDKQGSSQPGPISQVHAEPPSGDSVLDRVR
jgi:hypothetical protein